MSTVSHDPREVLVDTLIPGLHASEPEALGFGPDLEIRAFLLERPQGNLLVYRSAALEAEADALRDLGGIRRQYLNHWHEASPSCDWVAQTFDAPLHCHADDAAKVGQGCEVAETFAERHVVDEDLEVIPTPGHTPGATCFLWDSGEYRCLFTGDTLFLSGGDWIAAVLESSDRRRYIQSLELLRDLDVDLLVPSIARAGQPYHELVERSDAGARIDSVVERLRAGADR